MDKIKKLWAVFHQWWKSLPEKTAAVVLDWLLLGASLMLIVVIYIPQGIWAEENSAMDESRRRLAIISKTQDLFHTITSEWTTDGDYLFQLMSQAHDTLTGDTTFIGKQIVIVNELPRRVNIPGGLGYQMDTTFSSPRPVRNVILDTTYTVVLWDAELASHDTIYLTGIKSLVQFEDDPAFRGIPDTAYGSHIEVDNDYSWYRYRLTPNLLSSPVTGERFILEIDSTGTLSIIDPLPINYSEYRFLFFRYKPRNIGRIEDGIPSWKGR